MNTDYKNDFVFAIIIITGHMTENGGFFLG